MSDLRRKAKPPPGRGASLQPGIYLERGVPPPAAWRVLLLNVRSGTSSGAAREALSEAFALLGDLQAGVLPELGGNEGGSSVIPTDSFVCLAGYGASLFERSELTSVSRPAHLVRLRQNGPAFPSIPWAPGTGNGRRFGEADLLLQFTGDSDHAVSRAAVEVCHLLRERGLPLDAVDTFDGFRRDDGRSWIGFHDGVSNLEPSQRVEAVESKGDPDWNKGGTYLAFLRLEIAIESWRQLSRTEQELIIGRDKLTGCPLVGVERTTGRLRPLPMRDCPFDDETSWVERDAFFNPPDTGSALIEASHTHRVNQNRGSPPLSSGHRIFRQGYEYLDSISAEGTRLGLNFVSFQSDLYHLQQILGLSGWLGDVNFGGPASPGAGEPVAIPLISLVTGGLYVVPPREEPFPGSSLFAADGGNPS